MDNKKNVTGTAVDRIDGILKVTGKATYSTDHPVKNVAHAIIIKSTIASGVISEIDTTEAEKAVGVLKIITHKNAPELNENGGIRGGALLQNANILFQGQHIGVVVAETFEQARSASRLIKVQYKQDEGVTDFKKVKSIVTK